MTDARAFKAALLVPSTALTSPHLLDYDLVVLAPALAFLTLVMQEDGARDYDKSLMALIWFTPLAARSVADLFGIPLGLFATLALLMLILRRRQRRVATSLRLSQV